MTRIIKSSINKKSKYSYLFISSVIVVVYILLPVTRILPNFVKAGVVIISSCFGLLGLYNVYARTRTFYKIVLIILLVLLLNLIIYLGVYKHYSNIQFLSRYMVMFTFWLSIFWGYGYCQRNENHKLELKRIQNLIVLLLIITATTTIIGTFLFHEASRSLASGDIESNRIYQAYNIGGYGFIYCLVLTIPYLIFRIKTDRSILYILILVLFVICIISSSYMLAILLSLYAVISCLFFIQKEGKQKILILLLLLLIIIPILFILFSDNQFWDLLLSIVDDNPTLYERTLNLKYLFIYRQQVGDLNFRSYLYKISWQAFLQNPWLGNIGNKTVASLGYHSEILDLLGGTGLLGGGFAFLIILNIVKVYNRAISKKRIASYYTIMCTILLIIASLNTIISSLELSVIIGYMYLPISSIEK